MHKNLFPILLFVWASANALPSSPEISVSCETETTTVAVPVVYSVKITHENDIFIKMPDDRLYVDVNGTKLPRYIITDKKIDKTHNGNRYEWSVTISLVYLQTGIWDLPQIEISDSESNRYEYISKKIEIEATNQSGTQEDIEGPLALRGNYYRIVLIVLLIVFVIVSTYFIYIFLKNKFKKKEVIQNPYERFIKETSLLYSEKLIDSDFIEEHMQRLSIIFRHFVSDYFHCNGLESTSDELLNVLSSKIHEKAIIERTRKIVFLWDLSKFAELRPSQEIARMNHRDTVKLVENLYAMDKSHE